MSALVLGLDGGGTQTRVLVEDIESGARGEGIGGACNIAAVSVGEAVQSVRTATEAALANIHARAKDVQAVCVGVAGTSFASRRAEFQTQLQRLFPRAVVGVEPDYAIALTGATGGLPGVIVIAGTGSVAYGENADGQGHKAGGYGYLLDDAGSGYGVGQSALVAVLRAADGTGEATSLSRSVCAALGLETAGEIVAGVYGGGLSRVAIASLSRVVSEAAADDAVARAILMRAGGALAQLVHGVAAALFADTAAEFPVVPVVPVGGLWQAGGPLTDVFERSVRRFAPQAVIHPAQQPPVSGAVHRARQMLVLP